MNFKPSEIFSFSAVPANRGFKFILFFFLNLTVISAGAQVRRPPEIRGGGTQGRPGRPELPGAGGGDSLQRRDNNEDSITIFYRMYDSSRVIRIDSTIGDFTKRFPIPNNHVYLGSLGAATKSLVFDPQLKAGFDPGIHAYDVYKYTVANTRIFQTTRPYSELDYFLGSRSEQLIKILHTQNIRPYWNAAFEFRFANSPGNFKNNSASHSNMRFTSAYTSKKRRYSNFLIYLSNNQSAAQNGGIQNESYILSDNRAYMQQRFTIPTWLGGDADFRTNFFATNVTTGLKLKEKTFVFRQNYDIGQQDSVINAVDSTVSYLFYPRLRLQHNLKLTLQDYLFQDPLAKPTSPYLETVYIDHFGLTNIDSTFYSRDRWRDISNEFAILLYPQKDNQEQFLKMGAGLQLLQGRFDSTTIQNYQNTFLFGEYRNRTKNRKWDINVSGKLFMLGFNGGDYEASVSLLTQLGSNAGSLLLSFMNSNREPGFIYHGASDFVGENEIALKKENWTRISGQYILPLLNVRLNGNYYMVTNYTHFKNYGERAQEGSLIPILHLAAEKDFKFGRFFHLYSGFHIQTEGSNVINLPLVYSQNRLAFEGQFFKNLTLSSGIEVRYYSPYTMDHFNPFNGTFFPQNAEKISNRPDLAAYLNFRIRSFRLYSRVENLNTVDPGRGFRFVSNNYAAPLYPMPGLFMRAGVFWSFVN